MVFNKKLCQYISKDLEGVDSLFFTHRAFNLILAHENQIFFYIFKWLPLVIFNKTLVIMIWYNFPYYGVMKLYIIEVRGIEKFNKIRKLKFDICF